MKRFAAVWCLLGVAAIVGVGQLKQDQVSAGPARNMIDDEGQVMPVEDSMHEFMEYVFQPTYRRLKVSMAAEPADNAGWKAVKSDALILAESCNLLYGRKPEENGGDWIKHATASRSAGGELYKAAKAKDFAAATTSWKAMLNQCNACHRQFEDGKHILQP